MPPVKVANSVAVQQPSNPDALKTVRELRTASDQRITYSRWAAVTVSWESGNIHLPD